MAIALIDLDGTLADYDGAMAAELAALRSPGEPPVAWTRENEPPWIKARRNLIAIRPGFWHELRPLACGFEVYRMLLELGFETHILTKGPTSKSAAWSEKVTWAREHTPESMITITEDKSLVYGRVLVDDWPEYVKPWLEAHRRGLVVMPAQSWNEDFRHPRAVRYGGMAGEAASLRALLQAARDRKDGEPLIVP